MFEVEELQKNCREFEGGSGFSAEAGFVVLLTELASVLNSRQAIRPGGGVLRHQVLADILPCALPCLSCDFFSFSIVVV